MPDEIKKFYLPLARVHCMKGAEWGHSMATDYWLTFNSGFDILAAASTATGQVSELTLRARLRFNRSQLADSLHRRGLAEPLRSAPRRRARV